VVKKRSKATRSAESAAIKNYLLSEWIEKEPNPRVTTVLEWAQRLDLDEHDVFRALKNNWDHHNMH